MQLRHFEVSLKKCKIKHNDDDDACLSAEVCVYFSETSSSVYVADLHKTRPTEPNHAWIRRTAKTADAGSRVVGL